MTILRTVPLPFSLSDLFGKREDDPTIPVDTHSAMEKMAKMETKPVVAKGFA